MISNKNYKILWFFIFIDFSLVFEFLTLEAISNKEKLAMYFFQVKYFQIFFVAYFEKIQF